VCLTLGDAGRLGHLAHGRIRPAGDLEEHDAVGREERPRRA
jgi:hypothetical protein